MAAGHPDVRLFRRLAEERLGDAEYLLAGDRPRGAAYLGGYAAECVLKALILAATPRGREAAVTAGFRGLAAHDLSRLARQYRAAGGAPAPEEVRRDLARLSVWEVGLRYDMTAALPGDVRAFLDAAGRLIAWASGRL